jgi:predicted metalloenzyme YecM
MNLKKGEGKMTQEYEINILSNDAIYREILVQEINKLKNSGFKIKESETNYEDKWIVNPTVIIKSEGNKVMFSGLKTKNYIEKKLIEVSSESSF